MRLFDPDPNLHWLFLFTHPDDELTVAAWIRHLSSVGASVTLGWVHSTPVRRQEALRAAESLGVDDTFFLSGTDGRIVEEMPQLLQPLRSEVRTRAPDRLVVNAFEQGHLDHDATNFLAHQVFMGPTLEVPLYHTYLTRTPIVGFFADSRAEEVRELSHGERVLKRDLAKGYPSQAIWRNLFWAEARCRLDGGSLLEAERMRLQTHSDYRTPNLPESLSQNVQRCEHWHRWLAGLSAFEAGVSRDRRR